KLTIRANFRLRAAAPIQLPVTHGFGDGGGLDLLVSGQIRNGAGYAQDAMIVARRQFQAGAGTLQELSGLWVNVTALVDLSGTERGIGITGASLGTRSGGGDALAYGFRAFATVGGRHESGRTDRRHAQVHVDTIQQRSGQAA